MESIDALRDWWRDRFPVMDDRLGIEFRWRIDAIESEVNANRVDAYTKGYDEGFASADDLAAQHEDAMAEHGWVRLPVDADGVPIHVGDVMEWYQGGNVFTVTALHLVSREWEVWGDDAEYAPDVCHHHEPTVEDVLREFACYGIHIAVDEGMRAGEFNFSIDEEVLAECAAKLRLAGDE